MGQKKQSPTTFYWQSTAPNIGMRPFANSPPAPSTQVNGSMSGTNTIYSQIFEVSDMDNIGLEVTWTGTPVGTISVSVSNSGINFYPLTFNPLLSQPNGAAGGYAIALEQLPYKYFWVQYTNTSGSGTLTIYGQQKDLN